MVLDFIKYSMKYLRRKKLRSFLTVTGIAVGISAVVLISSIGEIGKNLIQSELNQLGLGSITIVSDWKYTGAALGEPELELIRGGSQVENAIPVMVDYTKLYMRGLSADCVAWGIDTGARQIFSLQPVYGRLFRQSDIEQRRPVCIVDKKTAMLFYKRENIVGKKIQLFLNTGYQELEVIGVVESGGSMLQGLIGEVVPSFVYLPYSTAQQLTGKSNFDQIAVKLASEADADLIGKELVNTLKANAGVQNGYRSENVVKQKDSLNDIVQIVTVVLSLVAAVSLLVAGLGIMTIMMVSVNERTREIGIKKSIGAKKRTILLEFIIESAILSLRGGFFGILFGYGALAIGCWLLAVPFVWNIQLLGACFGFALLIGVLFGAYPAYAASQLNPVDALRYE